MIALLCSGIVRPVGAQALPLPGTSVGLTAAFKPTVLVGLKIHPENPLLFDFIVDQGTAQLSQDQLKSETEKLVKYFLAALTIPEKEVWVNLSPYEKDRIIPDALGQTGMGKTMLEQDYLLKQLASSLTNPDEKMGQEFWAKVKGQVQSRLGTTAVPMNTFNKVWIVPQNAEVLESDGIVVVGDKRLKVMMDQDYAAMSDQKGISQPSASSRNDVSEITSEIFRKTILPTIEKEINEGKNFADVRQIYNSVILAAWYKQALKDSLLGKIYADKGKISGVEIDEKDIKKKIYEQYLAAFNKGVYNLIKEEPDSATGDLIPRKYFSGGLEMRFNGSASSPLNVRRVNLSVVANELSDLSFDGFLASFQMAAEMKERTVLQEVTGVKSAEAVLNGIPVIIDDSVGNPVASSKLPGVPIYDADVKLLARTIIKMDKNLLASQRFNDYMRLFEYAAGFQDEYQRIVREHDIYGLFLKDPLFTENQQFQYIIADLVDQALTAHPTIFTDGEFVEKYIVPSLQAVNQLLKSSLVAARAYLERPESLARPQFENTRIENDPARQRSVERIIRRVLIGNPNPGVNIDMPQEVYESVGAIFDQVVQDSDKAFRETNLLNDQTGIVLQDQSLAQKILAVYDKVNEVMFQGMGISMQVRVSSTKRVVIPEMGGKFPAGEEILVLSKPFVDIVKDEATKSWTAALALDTPSAEPAAAVTPSRRDLLDSLPADSRQLTNYLVQLSDQKLIDLVLAVFNRPDLKDVLNTREENILTKDAQKVYSLKSRSLALLFVNAYLRYSRNPELKQARETELRMARMRLGDTSSSSVENASPVGGIDFDASKLNLQIKRDGKGVPLPLPQQNIERINIEGLFPVIINIEPINTQTLPVFLGKVSAEPDVLPAKSQLLRKTES